MKLFHRLKLSGLLSFGPDGIDLPMERLNVLIGPNGSGKSNLLAAVSLLQAAPRGITEPISRSGGVREWTWKDEKASASIAMDVTVSFSTAPMMIRGGGAALVERNGQSTDDCPPGGTLRHHLTLDDWDGRAIVADERVEPLNTSIETSDETAYYRPPRDKEVAEALNLAVRQVLESKDVRDPIVPQLVRGREGALEFASAYRPDESLLSFYASPEFPALWHLREQYGRIRFFRDWSFGPNATLRQPCSAHARSDFLAEGGENLPLVLSNLHGEHRRKLLDALRKLFDGIVDFRCSVTGGTVSLFLEESGGRSIPATRLSNGTLRYLCLLAVLLHPEPPSLIGIEEPELGLHPDMLPGLADLLVEASERTQLIVTTHSDVLVDELTERPESVVACEKYDGQTRMRRLDQAGLAKWLQGRRLGDVWTSPTLDQLAKAQNVGPLDADALMGTWPGDENDGFEAAIDELRCPGSAKDARK